MSLVRVTGIAALLGILTLPVVGQTADELFDSQQLHEVRLAMTASDWQALHENYLADTFYPCRFEWNGYVLDKIGIRSRGSQSRSPIKPSIGLDFSKYASTQRFAGLKTLVMRNLNQDASMMHEYLAEKLFAKLGLPHSREAYAKLFVNGEYAGVYLMVEPIDARLVKVRLGEDTGWLYDMQNLEFVWRFEYLGPELEKYIPGLFDPKTNSSAPDAEGVREMIRVVNEVHDNDFYTTVSRYIDLEAVVAHAAAETATSNWDGVLGINGMRNFYLYRWRDDKRALFLAWDMDGAFSDIQWPLFAHAEKNVLLRRALQVPALRQRYIEFLDAAAHAMAEGDWMYRELARVYQLIQPWVYADPYKLCRTGEGIGRCTDAMFEAEVQHLVQFAYARPEFLWSTLRGEPLHDPDAPDLHPGAVVTLTSELPRLAPGSLANLKTPLNVSGPIHATAMPLPDELGGVWLETEKGAAKLIEVCPAGITFVVPAELECGPQTLRVWQNGHVSNTIAVELRPTATVIFAATHADGSAVCAEWPAGPGEWIVLYATGVWRGEKPAITARIGAAEAKVVWAGEAPGFAGLQQLVIEAPADLPPGVTATLQVLVDGETGSGFALPVRR